MYLKYMGSKLFCRHTCSLWKKNQKTLIILKCCHELHTRPSTGIGSTNLMPIDLARSLFCFLFQSSQKLGNPSKDIPDVPIQLTFHVTRFLFGCLRASWVRWSPTGLSACHICCNLCDGHGVCVHPALQMWKKSRCVEPLGAGAAAPRSR